MIHTFKGRAQHRASEYSEPYLCRRRADPAVNSPPGRAERDYRKCDTVTREAQIEMSIDIDRLIRMLGERAVKSKSGRSSYLSGIIKTKIVGARVETERKPVEWYKSNVKGNADYYEEVTDRKIP